MIYDVPSPSSSRRRVQDSLISPPLTCCKTRNYPDKPPWKHQYSHRKDFSWVSETVRENFKDQDITRHWNVPYFMFNCDFSMCSGLIRIWKKHIFNWILKNSRVSSNLSNVSSDLERVVLFRFVIIIRLLLSTTTAKLPLCLTKIMRLRNRFYLYLMIYWTNYPHWKNLAEDTVVLFKEFRNLWVFFWFPLQFISVVNSHFLKYFHIYLLLLQGSWMFWLPHSKLYCYLAYALPPRCCLLR